MMLAPQTIPVEVFLGENGVYGDVEAFICAYVESGDALRDWLRLWQQRIEDWEQWTRVNGGAYVIVPCDHVGV